MSVGSEIKRIRSINKLSASLLAKAIGVSPDRLRKWESKDLHPNLEDAQKIERYFGVPLSELENIEKLKFSYKNIPNDNEDIIITKQVPDIYQTFGEMEARLVKLEASVSFLKELLQGVILGKASSSAKLSSELSGEIDEIVAQIAKQKTKKMKQKV